MSINPNKECSICALGVERMLCIYYGIPFIVMNVYTYTICIKSIHDSADFFFNKFVAHL